ncbi:hypothetical protein [Jiella sonneratiae]|uniref:Uncharacterized protein n=1 Tax=Jiella sonneratiae TaxID=2816856 RepID=A0ABS3J0Y9_9HYPH|nr:hypothetical protein [Jiella sonneratiae]MBO0903332.1 hypothetical protein [Jiella sonneratiae]
MAEPKSERSDFLGMLRADVHESVGLYFAPLKAVLREFRKAIATEGSQTGSAATSSGGRDTVATGERFHELRE